MRRNLAAVGVTVVSADASNAYPAPGPTTTAVPVTSNAAASAANEGDTRFDRDRRVDRTKSATTAAADRAAADLLAPAHRAPGQAAASVVGFALVAL